MNSQHGDETMNEERIQKALRAFEVICSRDATNDHHIAWTDAAEASLGAAVDKAIAEREAQARSAGRKRRHR